MTYLFLTKNNLIDCALAQSLIKMPTQEGMHILFRWQVRVHEVFTSKKKEVITRVEHGTEGHNRAQHGKNVRLPHTRVRELWGVGGLALHRG